MAVEMDEDELIEYWTLAGEELGQAWQGCALQSLCPGDPGFRHPQGQEVTPADDLAIAEGKTLKIWPTVSRSPGVPLNPGPRRPTITCCPASIASTAWTVKGAGAKRFRMMLTACCRPSQRRPGSTPSHTRSGPRSPAMCSGSRLRMASASPPRAMSIFRAATHGLQRPRAAAGLTWPDRAWLALLAGTLPIDRLGRMRLIVTPATILCWHRDIVRRRWARRSQRGRSG